MNKKFGFKDRQKNIAQQVAFFKRAYPLFNLKYDHKMFKAVGELKPTARSTIYTIEIRYNLSQPPKIQVLNPELTINFNGDKIPHVYPGNRLCLYRPKYNEFIYSDYISDTIVPWTSLWLYYYELWHITGEWKGGGEHPNLK